jgi:flagellar hook protein FlgE
MNGALLSGVSGLDAHQKMLDVAGNNLANVSTTAFKSSRVSFAEMLGNTLRQASQPTDAIGGTNPQQVGSGVTVASIDRNMNQGGIVNTGQSLDMAIDGSGYFVLNDGKGEVYTRAGAFTVDQDYYLVDPATGYRVQRIGSEGESEGFQDVSSSAIRVPYDVALPANITSTINYTGNLSADESNPTTNILSSGMEFTKAGAMATEAIR